MDVSKAFPSTYLKAQDLGRNTPVVTITDVAMETIGDDSKMVVYFAEGKKGLVLNKTNANTIVDLLGSTDTDQWTGKKIMLITAKVEFQGKRVPAIRIEEAPKPKTGRASEPAAPATREPGDDDDAPVVDDIQW